MSELRTRDLRAAFEVALEAQAAQDKEELRSGLLPALRRLVGCDSLGYNEIDLERGSVLGIVDPPGVKFDGFEEAFASIVQEHPLVACQQRGDLSTRALSDFLSARQLHRRALYHDFYKLIAAEDQLAFGLPGPMMVAFALCRSRPSFTNRDRQVLELVRPHLAAAYDRVRERERARALVRALDEGLEEHHTGMIQADSRGRIAHMTAGAEALLDAYVDGASCPREHVPAKLRALIDAAPEHPAPTELTIEGPRGRLHVRARAHRSSAEWHTLILSERRARPPSTEALLRLELSPRQAQVLRLIACGKSSRQVAGELQISRATVDKHLENIYARLGVHTRAQALARVYS